MTQPLHFQQIKASLLQKTAMINLRDSLRCLNLQIGFNRRWDHSRLMNSQ
jgi:hypothetical protein